MKLLERLKFNEKYAYYGTAENLDNKLKTIQDPIITKLANNQLKINASLSLGTLMSLGGGSGRLSGITVLASISEIEEKKQLIHFTTRIKIEHFFFLFIFMILFITGIVTIINNGDFGFLLTTLILWPICHLWFQYRMQEETVVGKIVQKLNLRRIKINPSLEKSPKI